jgi:hypothetical protein
MSKEGKALTWEDNNEEVRRLFTLTPDDLYFLRPLRTDSQHSYMVRRIFSSVSHRQAS